MQGHLRSEPIAVTIETECAHCSRSMQIEVDSELAYHVRDGADPLIFIPDVNFKKLRAPNIIDAF